MKYNREESFRFNFNPPFPGYFTITKMKGLEGMSKMGKMEILDLSPGGVKFQSLLELPVNQDTAFSLSFTLNEENELILPGSIIWKQKKLNHYHYGFDIAEDAEKKDMIIQELKKFRKSRL
ncbi:PilZ domain-containing protein [Bacillus sp. MUM 13]|uniref:PilZ domain-containing protein n=1 Tax=Bacillus sp. MUM 13 TaxID=1678001 RepID=UPI0008F58ED0|nr:PilZ domain-containing protein [Bacillus sp. MUM 13]OIK14475.1 hypothetical protein BIV59_02770 [Bacillus sp. MUM 13]